MATAPQCPALIVMAAPGEAEGVRHFCSLRRSSPWEDCATPKRPTFCANCWKPRRCGSGSTIERSALRRRRRWPRSILATAARFSPTAAWSWGTRDRGAGRGAGLPWVRQRRYERIVLRRLCSATISSSWGKSSILIREMSLGGGMGTKEDNLRIGSEANLDISMGVRHVRAQVLLRRARVNEVGFEIVNTDLESRYPPAPHPGGGDAARPRRQRRSGTAIGRAEVWILPKSISENQSLCQRQRLSVFLAKICYLTLAKIITKVYRARDSISARPRISAS